MTKRRLLACLLGGIVSARLATAATYEYAGGNQASGQMSNAWNVAASWSNGSGAFPNQPGDVATTAEDIDSPVHLYLNEDITVGTFEWSGSFLDVHAGSPAGRFIVDNRGVPATWRIRSLIFFSLNPDMVLNDDLTLSISNSAGFTTWPEPVSLTGVISGPGRLVLDVPVPVLNTFGMGATWNAPPNTYSGGTRLIGHPSGGAFFEPKKNGSFGTGDVEVNCDAKLILRDRSANNDYVADTAALRLESADVTNRASVYLESGVNERVGELLIDGVAQPAGTYGAQESSAAEPLDEFLSGPGILTVSDGPLPPGSVRNLPPQVTEGTNLWLRGQVVETAALPTWAYVYWGPRDGGRSTEAWRNLAFAGSVVAGVFAVPIGAQPAGETFFYRCFLTNALGGRWAGRTSKLAPPVVTNEPPVARQEHVRLGASVLGPDNPPTTVLLYWGTNDGGTNVLSWQNSLTPDATGSGTVSADLLTIRPDTVYYFRAYASNALGEAWSPQSGVFKTPSPPVYGEVTFFFASDLHYGFTAHVPTSAELASATLDRINAIPGQPYPVSVGGGFVDLPRGVLLIGDETDTGTEEQWMAFTNDWGLNGDRRLAFPIYECFGNHDLYEPLVAEFIKARNPFRRGVTHISTNGYHYSWDWDSVHLVGLNLFPGNGTDPGFPPYSPEESLNFLIDDLAANVGNSGKPVILVHHFGLDDLTRVAWWSKRQQDEYYEAIKNYNVIAILSGHNHALMLLDWNGILHCTDATIGKFHGTFFVARVTRTNITLIERTSAGEWGAMVSRPISLPPAPDTTIPLSNASWRYHDLGVDLGPDWRAPDYNDATWPRGPAPLGFGSGGEQTVLAAGVEDKPLTVHFRQTFEVPEAASGQPLSARLRCDDGAVVYLNGVEVFRHNLPPGEIGFQTSALAAVDGSDEATWVAFSVPSEALRPGTNVLAVAVHQYAGDKAPVAFWTLDEAAAPWRDAMGGHDFATVGTNVVAWPGKVEGCASNSALATDYLATPDAPGLRFSGPFTVGGWFAFGLATGDDPASTCLEKAGEFRLYYSGTAINRYWFRVGDTGVQDQTGATKSGQWRFVVGWYDGVNACIQVDNGSVYAVVAAAPVATTNPLVALKRAGPLGGFAADEVFFYQRTLSASERAALYTVGLRAMLATNVEDLAFDFELTAVVAQRPEFEESPASLVRREGANAAFRLTAASSSPVGYQWQLNGSPIAGATETLLFLSGVTPAQAGFYALVASNLGGAVTSAPARLTVVSPPVLNARWRAAGGGFELQLPACEVASTLLGSTNLVDWAPALVRPAGSGATNWVVTPGLTVPQRYYRLRLE